MIHGLHISRVHIPDTITHTHNVQACTHLGCTYMHMYVHSRHRQVRTGTGICSGYKFRRRSSHFFKFSSILHWLFLVSIMDHVIVSTSCGEWASCIAPFALNLRASRAACRFLQAHTTPVGWNSRRRPHHTH